MNRKFDFIAELKYRTTEQGGRKTPANSGYRPHLEFEFTEMLTSGHQFFIGTDLVNPGETVLAQIGMNSTYHYEGQLEVGTEFKFCEGSLIIGIGKITEIINKSLEKKKAST
ncbi:hypothetical protein ACFFU1_11575 [Algibacter miyuki]|uniref:Translation elongation factor EFTu/EF1A C-terminal domain-containing protein n=1 Tax=Algibacter miyuki TaxID=1306933 RepID=A0ABV5H0X1_9FLAO|nr:hypothetical protein [Algibacter miyuki]MDN3664392.1 hypothetical protein [Algibacter miyuki]